MAELIEVPVDGGESFLIETDRRLVHVGRGADQLQVAQETFQRSLDRVQEIANLVVGRLSSLARQPDSVKVEFGVKLTGEASVVVTRTTGEAHFVLTLEWQKAHQSEAE
jgi:hypothetical protein